MSLRRMSAFALVVPCVVLWMFFQPGCNPLESRRDDGAVRITPNEGSEQNPCLSPNGGSFVFTRFHEGYNDGPSALVLWDLDTGQEEVLLDDDEHDFVNLPGRCFSPDGSLLTYSSDADEQDEVWILDLLSRSRTKLTGQPGSPSTEPSFSRDGSAIFFQRTDGGEAGVIWSVDVYGSNVTQITDGSADDRQPNGSPLEDRVLFQSDRGGTWGLWTAPAAGGEPVELLDTPAEETDASWSPDGHMLVFATDSCSAISCAATFADDEIVVNNTPEEWYEGAVAVDDGGMLYVEATDGDPEDGHNTAIYRLE